MATCAFSEKRQSKTIAQICDYSDRNLTFFLSFLLMRLQRFNPQTENTENLFFCSDFRLRLFERTAYKEISKNTRNIEHEEQKQKEKF